MLDFDKVTNMENTNIEELKEAFALITHLLEDYRNGPECNEKEALLRADEGFELCDKADWNSRRDFLSLEREEQ